MIDSRVHVCVAGWRQGRSLYVDLNLRKEIKVEHSDLFLITFSKRIIHFESWNDISRF